VTRFLLDSGVSPNSQGGFFGNAMQAASYEGHVDIVQMLLESGANANMGRGMLRTALEAACCLGHSNVIERLLCVSKRLLTCVSTNHNIRTFPPTSCHNEPVCVITSAVLGVVATGYLPHVMALLLDLRGSEVKIPEEVVKAVAGNEFGVEMMNLLLDRRGSKVNISEEVVNVTVRNKRYRLKMTALLLDRPEVRITQEVVKAAVEDGSSGEEMISLLLDRRGSEVMITEEVVEAAGSRALHSYLDALRGNIKSQDLDGFDMLSSTLSRCRLGGEWRYIKAKRT